MALRSDLDDHLRREFGAPKFTVSGSTATIPTTTTLRHEQLVRLMEVAQATSHKVAFGSTGITVAPK